MINESENIINELESLTINNVGNDMINKFASMTIDDSGNYLISCVTNMTINDARNDLNQANASDTQVQIADNPAGKTHQNLLISRMIRI